MASAVRVARRTARPRGADPHYVWVVIHRKTQRVLRVFDSPKEALNYAYQIAGWAPRHDPKEKGGGS